MKPWNGAVFILCLVLAGCGPVPVPSSRTDPNPIPEEAWVASSSGRRGGTLHYALAGEPATFNPAAARDTRSRLFGYLTSATLLEFDPLEQKVVCGICREWRREEDGRTLVLTLRRGIRFSDGIPLTSADVVFTFRKIYQEGSHNVPREGLVIEGQPAAVTAVDAATVRIRFPKPYAPAAYLLTNVPVLPRHRFADADKPIEEYWGVDTPPREMAGLGPFVLESHEPGRRSVLAANPHYWRVDSQGLRLPYLDRLVVDYVPDRNNHLLRFQAGQLDLMDQTMRPEDFRQLESRGAHLERVGPSSALTFLWFNLGQGGDLSAAKRRWFGDVRFRLAVSAAVSRRDIVQNVFQGLATPAWSIVPPSLRQWYAPDLPRPPQALERARQLLHEARFALRTAAGKPTLVDTRGRAVELEIVTRSDPVYGKIAAMVEQDLGKLGIQVHLRQEEFRSVISRVMGSRQYEAALMSLDIPVEPADQASLLLSNGAMHVWDPGQQQTARPWERRLDQIMLRQVVTLDAGERRRLYHQALEILYREAPIVPLVFRDTLVAVGKRVHNAQPSSLFPYALWNVWQLWVDE